MKFPHCESLNDLPVAEAIAAVDEKGTLELAVSIDFWDLENEKDWEDAQGSFSDYFDRKVKEYSLVLGETVFRGGMNEPGFPENYMEQFNVHADELVLWNYRGAQYGLSTVQEDRELPFIVSFVKMDAVPS